MRFGFYLVYVFDDFIVYEKVLLRWGFFDKEI